MAVGRVSPRTVPEKLAGECLGWNLLYKSDLLRSRACNSSKACHPQGLHSRLLCMLPLSCTFYDGGGGGTAGYSFSTTRGRGSSHGALLRCRSQSPKVQRLYVDAQVCTLSPTDRSEEMPLQSTKKFMMMLRYRSERTRDEKTYS